ncbi:MAG: SurA N-terminal domain-containing protein [Gammaproteobacteria bacterium]
MKKYINLFLIIVFTCVAAIASAQPMEPLNKIVAVVNDQEITQNQLDQAYAFFKAQIMMTNQGELPPEYVLKKQVLKHMIDTSVQMQMAKKAKISATPQEISHAIAGIAKSHNMSVNDFYKKLGAYGVSEKTFRHQIEQQVVTHKLIQRMVIPTVKVTQPEVDHYKSERIEQARGNMEYHLYDILIALPDSPSSKEIEAAKAKADDLFDALKKGKDFKLVMNSDNGTLGNDLGWRKTNQLPEIFTKAVKGMKINQVKGPILAPNGFHIIQLVGKRATGIKALSDKQIQALLFKRKVFDAIDAWVAKIRAQSYVKINSYD